MDSVALDPVGNADELDSRLAREPAVLVYFSTPECRVCRALRPKIAELLAREFPRVTGLYLDCAAVPAAAARHQVFAVPTLLAFFEGREWLRKGRSVSLDELRAGLARPYRLLFDPGGDGEDSG